eukprot:TRINITY_DN38156_c0_g1_i1.p1 TRINITY_DN38156_c0_g1~~TRINITY_DN38156_c0_g1_i1.p1  ORF type:complete len:659 (-),score=80.47 TRINITY_DN38156_c0_g1_i1:203-2179(-)
MGAEASFPHRVNVVCGGRYALSKNGWGECPVDVSPADKVLTTPSLRTAGSNRWIVKVLSEDECGRAGRIILRNDYHPQRSLRAGDTIVVDDAPWVRDHEWEMEYVDSLRSACSLSAPFHLRSERSSDRNYLTVDVASNRLTLQQEPPDMLWQFFDAAGPTTGLQLSFTGLHDLSSVELHQPVQGRCNLAVFEGGMEEAFECQKRTCDGSRYYTTPSKMQDMGVKLCEPTVIFDRPCTLYGFYLALYGDDAQLRSKLANGENPTFSPIRPLEHCETCGTGTLTQTVCVPVLGRRPYEEEIRLSLCCTDEANQLVVQISHLLKLGFPVGNFLSETMHIFSQDLKTRVITLLSYGVAQPGRGQDQAYAGMKEKQVELIGLIKELLKSTSSDVLETCADNLPPMGSFKSDAGLSDRARNLSSFTTAAERKEFAGSKLRHHTLPTRVNIICAGRYALSKRAHGDCVVAAVPANEVLAVPAERKSTSNRWYIYEGKERDEYGRPLTCIIRHDRHPMRSLRAGNPVLLDNRPWQTEHMWRIQYLSPPIENDPLRAAFHIRSQRTFDETYLTVNSSTMEVVMVAEKPTFVWRFYDAAATFTFDHHDLCSRDGSNGDVRDTTPTAAHTKVQTRRVSFSEEASDEHDGMYLRLVRFVGRCAEGICAQK